MVAIPLISHGRASGRAGLVERFMAWIHADVADEMKPTRSRQAPGQRADFVEHAAMSREMHRL